MPMMRIALVVAVFCRQKLLFPARRPRERWPALIAIADVQPILEAFQVGEIFRWPEFRPIVDNRLPKGNIERTTCPKDISFMLEQVTEKA